MSIKERKLTPAEQKRKENFEKICEKMAQNGYVRKDLTVGILQANIFAILIMLPFIAVTWIIYRAVNPDSSIYLSLGTIMILFLAMLLLTVLHEAIHGLTWSIFAKSHFKAIRFGIIWEALTPYCTCADPLTKSQYMIGSAMPTLILGFGPAAVAVIFGSFPLLVLSLLMIFGGGGDFLILLKMLFYRTKNKEVLYYDHPYECGVVAFEKAAEK